MLLKDLIDKGGFVSAEPVKKSIEWVHDVDGSEVTDKFDVWILKQSFGHMERVWSGPDDKSRSAALISECVRFGENAEERLTYDQAFNLHPGLATVLMVAFNEVNGNVRPKTSRPPRKSGAI